MRLDKDLFVHATYGLNQVLNALTILLRGNKLDDISIYAALHKLAYMQHFINSERTELPT